MRYGSVCSGIEAATMGWHSLGWEPVFYSEIERFPRAVLQHHYPEVPLHGDFTTIGEKQYGSIDLLVGGTPCQSFSIAGLRKGMDDDRGNLALEYIKLANRKRAKWVVWENVPGVFSSGGETFCNEYGEHVIGKGDDFGCFLSGLAGWSVPTPTNGWKNSGIITPAPGGYGLAWRVLDAQYFGVPQRRRRVFVVGYLGDWRPAAAVLFERESLQRDPPPKRKQREGAPSELAKSLRANSGGIDREDGHTLIEGRPWPVDVTSTLNHAYGDKQGLEDQHALEGASLFVPGLVGALTAKGPGTMGAPEVDAEQFVECGFQPSQYTRGEGGMLSNVAPTLTANAKQGDNEGHVCAPSPIETAIRRLTPMECERLQGFDDNFTKIPYRNKPADNCPDGPRYKALGNSMAVPVMHWLGLRISMVQQLKEEEQLCH